MAIPSPMGVLRREPPLRGAPGCTFPQKIWQTWKVDPTHFEERDLLVSRTWLEKNPGMRYEVLTDANEMAWIEEHFGPAGLHRPDIISFYRSIKLPIVKADLMRYMIMYVEGGIYADIDVEALRPFSRFIPARYDEEDIELIVGVEVDNPAFKDHHILGKKSMSFCQWTFISRPRLPVMMTLIENIMHWFHEVAKEQRVALGDVSLDFDQVISGTGPTAFTNAVLDFMNRRAKGPKITWDAFHNMDESRLVGGVLVLTVEAFCAGQGHSDSGNHNARNALVKHHFHASNWPSRHPRFRHPAYGQVEDCNWDAECVRKWDDNIANWEKFSADEQKEIVEQVKKAAEAKAQAEQGFWQQQLPPLQQAL
ncbi:Initiation-specific alpha-1 [Escovopsis weberi]|uniref:Initiation-specific alpha-1 n=1 Tax=Escovopsis weberi TaxID=150374 RepID=A0A0M9VTR3_ESCWE|nr:Initiation-specific alpha-1 [Escovopsis weberi]